MSQLRGFKGDRKTEWHAPHRQDRVLVAGGIAVNHGCRASHLADQPEMRRPISLDAVLAFCPV
jgi:hypothetical protein